jgi:hypothetical protein
VIVLFGENFLTNICKGGLCVSEFLNAYSGEKDHAPVVYVTIPWVASIFSRPYFTYHRCMSIYILKILVRLMCFLLLPSFPDHSNGASVDPTFEICVSANVPLPILGN